MDYFKTHQDQLFAEGVSLAAIAKAMGTPCYVYSRQALETHWKSFDKAFQNTPHQINYAVKANSNLAVLNILARLGSGFDIVSGGELERVLQAEGNPEKIIFSGVGKTAEELSRALTIGIGCINIESEEELKRIQEIATRLGKKANIAIRINPDIHSESHPYIATGLKENKFGISFSHAKTVIQRAVQLPQIQFQGVACHIGSQITTLSPFLTMVDKLVEFIQDLETNNISIAHLNLGGGLGVRYKDETPPTPTEYVNALLNKLNKIKKSKFTIHLEPGRAIVALAGILLTRVEYIKKQEESEKYFAIVDAGMNDLLRPALYDAWQNIVPAQANHPNEEPLSCYDIVGPVCETGDFLGKDRFLKLKQGDLLAILGAGAYGFSMSSNYNSRPRATEVMVDGTQFHIIRAREQIEDLFKSESLLSNT